MAKTAVNLNSLLRAIHNAVVDAQKITDQQHMRQLRSYFEWPESKIDQEGLLDLQGGKARTITIEVPNMHPEAGKIVQNDKGEWITVAPLTNTLRVPILSLVPMSSIKIDNMTMEFEVGLKGFMEDEPKPTTSRYTPSDPEAHHGPVHLDLGGISGGFFGGKKPSAKVKIEFKAGEPSEAIMRINDHLIKSIL